jgi:hypothetical protein
MEDSMALCTKCGQEAFISRWSDGKLHVVCGCNIMARPFNDIGSVAMALGLDQDVAKQSVIRTDHMKSDVCV